MAWFIINLCQKEDWWHRHEYYRNVLESTGRVHSLELMRVACSCFSPDELLDGTFTSEFAPPNSAIALPDIPRKRQLKLTETLGPPRKRVCKPRGNQLKLTDMWQ